MASSKMGPDCLTPPSGTTEPTGCDTGSLFYNTDEDTLKVYDGSSWSAVYEPVLTNIATLSNLSSTGYTGSTGVSGDVANLFDQIDRSTTTDWPSYGFQHYVGSSDGYVQFNMTKAFTIKKMAVVGYAGGSHYSNVNYFKGSNNGSTWTTIASWTTHPGNPNARGYLVYPDSGNHIYSYVHDHIDDYAITVDSSQSWQYFRLGGTNFNVSNGYQLVLNVILMGY